MDLKQWEKAVKLHISAIEILLHNILKKKYNVSLKEVDTSGTEDAIDEIQQPGKVIRFLEKNFQSEVFLSFSEAWVNQLSEQLLNGQSTNDKMIDDLIIEFSTHLMDMISGALAEVGIDIEMTNFEIIEEDKMARAFNLQQYFRANLLAAPEVPSGEEEQPFLELRVAASQPDKEVVKSYKDAFSQDDPFSDDRYTEVVHRYAQHVEIAQIENTTAANGSAPEGVSQKGKSVEFEDFGKTQSVKNTREVRNIDILKDVEMNLSVELGRREMPLGNILQLVKGSVIELEKLAGEPVDILVNGHKIAHGDVVVIDEHFGVRISNLLASQERLKNLQ